MYHTVFDITQKAYTWEFPAFGLIFLAFGIVAVNFPKLFQKPAPKKVMKVGWFFIIFSTLWTTTVFATTWGAYRKAVQAYQENTYQTVEGVVEKFIPMPASGHALERFEVNGVAFTYSDYVVTPGFNNTSSHGGPMRDGSKVKVGYIGNTILKLEMAE